MSIVQTKGLKRNTIDKYYTKENVVNICLDLVRQYITFGENDLIIEPSAGNGAFIRGIKMLSSHYRFYDINPNNPEIICQNYLEYTTNINEYEKIHIIGNPPFGRQSSIAKKFIKKSCEFCNSISFILPKSFKKNTLKNTFPLKYHLICEIDLPMNSFLVNDVEYDVPCVFQIWVKKTYDRIIDEQVYPNHFVFVKQDEMPDISIRRVGVNAGTISCEDLLDKSVQSHYFIKFTNNDTIQNNMNKLSTIMFEFDNTVGPKSLSKQELIKKYNLVL
jgi:predicted RNA methylase